MAAFGDCSAFRHAVIKADKSGSFEDVPNNDSIMDGKKLSGNAQYVSTVALGGSGIHIIALSKPGKQRSALPMCAVKNIQDQDWDPFSKNRLAAVSTDGNVHTWLIPDGELTSNMRETVGRGNSLKNALRGLAWHPSAENVLAVRSSRNIFVFKMDTDSSAHKEEVSTIDGLFNGDILCFAWAYDGACLAVTSKDKIVRIIDPRRTGKEAVLEQSTPGQSHAGARFANICWLGESAFFITAGHSSTQDRELLLWDSRKIDSGPVSKQTIDCGNMSPLLPVYDADTGLLAVLSRGGNAVRLFQISTSGVECKVSPLTNETIGSSSLQGAILLPKQANNVMDNEIMRILQLNVADSGRCSVDSVSVSVPRKDSNFQADLFPDTYRGGLPALTCEQYFAGENANPLKVAITASGVAEPSIEKLSVSEAPTAIPAAPASMEKVSASVPSELSVVEQEEERRKSSISSRLSNLGSSLKYRHLQLKYPVKDQTYFDLKPCKAANEGAEVACSEKFWATSYTGGGGPVYVSRHSDLGRISSDCNVVNGHSSAVSDIAFSPFDATVMATASLDCTVKVWNLPHDGPIPTMNADNASTTLSGFENSVRTANWHPTCANILACTSLDKTIRLFDVERSSQVACVSLEDIAGGADTTISNISFNYDGTQFAVASKDRVVRVCDPRLSGTAAVVSQSSSDSVLGRNLRVEWCCDGSNQCSTLLTVSVGSSGMRTIHLWDPRKIDTPLCTRQIDTAAGQLYPMYDASMGACFLVGKGDTIMRVYELNMIESSGSIGVICEKSCEFPAATDRSTYTGVCMLPKRSCNIGNIECARILKLTTESVQPISIKLPRADNLKTFFQDDIFRPIPSRSQHHVAGDYVDWLKDSEVFIGPFMESLQPDGMIPVSEKPKEEVKVSRVTSFRAQKDAEEKEERDKQANFNRLTEMANLKASYHPNQSMGGNDEIDSDDNWSDDD